MKNLLTLGYWFALLPAPFLRSIVILLLAVFGGMVAASIILRFIAAKHADNMYWARGGRKFARLFQWIGALGLLCVWMGNEQVYFFGARFWLLGLALIFGVWLAFLLKYVLKTIPKRAAEFAEKARIEKYLPHKK